MVDDHQVLTDADKRAVYDQYGEVPQPGGGRGSDDIFAEFFGSTPFTYCSTGGGGSNARERNAHSSTATRRVKLAPLGIVT